MIPLDLAHLYVHDLCTWRLKLRLITGRYYYLELDAPDHELAFLFDRWLRLINLLHEPTMSWAPRTMNTPPLDTPQDGVPASTWRLQMKLLSAPFLTECSLLKNKGRPRGCPSSDCLLSAHGQTTKHRFRSQAVGDSLPLLWSQLQPLEDQMKDTEKKSYLDACPAGSKTLIHISEKASITIRTIFSIISGTMNQGHHTSKASHSLGARLQGPREEGWGLDSRTYGCDSEGIDRGRLIETPTQCISHDTPDLPFMDSCDHMDTFLWTQDLDDLIDTQPTSLSSPLHTPPYSPAFYIFPPGSSFTKSKDKAWPIGSMKYMRPLPSPIKSRKTPLILDQSDNVPAEPAPAQKAPAASWSTQKSSAVPSCFCKAPPSGCQKTPSIPRSLQKIPVLVAQPQKTLPPILKFPQAPACSQKAVPPKKDFLVLNTQSQMAPAAWSQRAPDSKAKAPMDPSMLQAGDMLERKSEGQQEPVMVVGEQKMKVVGMKAQTTLQLPYTTTKKQSKEVLISKTQEGTLEALKGRGKSEDRAHKMEKTTMNLPDLKSTEIGMQKKWVLTQEVDVEGPCREDSRPFSVEGLALAKMMIVANSKQQHPKPTAISLPSWSSMTSRGSAMSMLANLPFNTSQTTLPERTQVVIREQTSSYTNVKENTQHQMEKNPPKDSLRTSKEPITELPKTVSDSSKVHVTSQPPISMPISGLKDTSQPLASITSPISKTESPVRVPQKPGVKHQGLKQAETQQQPLAVSGPILEILLPSILELEDERKMSTKNEIP
ncbi:hypothetical protein A6R68_04676, partial [Neotoma lepida]